MGDVLRTIPSVQTPVQAATLIAAVALIVLSRWSYLRYRATLQVISKLPPGKQAEAIFRDLGKPLPPRLSPEKFLAYTRLRYRFLLALSIVVSITCVLLWTKAVFVQSISVKENNGTFTIQNGSAPSGGFAR